MSYLSLSDKDKAEMLARTGVGSVEDLFCCIPEAVRLKRPLDLPAAQSEIELVRTIGGLEEKDPNLAFAGRFDFIHQRCDGQFIVKFRIPAYPRAESSGKRLTGLCAE